MRLYSNLQFNPLPNGEAAWLDLVFSKNESLHKFLVATEEDLQIDKPNKHHLRLTFESKFEIQAEPITEIEKPNYLKANFEEISRVISNLELEALTNEDHPLDYMTTFTNTVATTFDDQITQAVNTYIPLHTIKNNDHMPPWAKSTTIVDRAKKASDRLYNR